MIHFFDSYALLEIIFANENYANYRESQVMTSKLQLLEMHYALLRLHGEDVADKYYDDFLAFDKEPTHREVRFASRIRFEHKKRRLSYADCLGYAMARSRNIPFLTGDKEFRDLPGVEFVS